jgi:hypothetical protein
LSRKKRAAAGTEFTLKRDIALTQAIEGKWAGSC